jgi:hypothetical protein
MFNARVFLPIFSRFRLNLGSKGLGSYRTPSEHLRWLPAGEDTRKALTFPDRGPRRGCFIGAPAHGGEQRGVEATYGALSHGGRAWAQWAVAAGLRICGGLGHGGGAEAERGQRFLRFILKCARPH